MRYSILPSLSLIALALTDGPVRAPAQEQRAQTPDKTIGFGLELKPDNTALSVMKVLSGSPAERAGLVVGDRILAINGEPTAKLKGEQIGELLKGKEGSFVLLAVASQGKQLRAVRVMRAGIDVAGLVGDAAAGGPRLGGRIQVHIGAADGFNQQGDGFNQQIAANIDRLREPLAQEIQFMAKVAALNAEQIKSLERGGKQAIERRIRPTAHGGAGRLVRRHVVVVNGKPELREELNEPPPASVRRELTPVLKAISFAAWEKFDAERERLEERRGRADVLVQVAAFDEALLLTREQREKLCQLLSHRWTDVWRGHANEKVVNPAELCSSAVSAMDLFSIRHDELEAILLPAQLTAYQMVQMPTKIEAVFVQDAGQAEQAAPNEADINLVGVAPAGRRFGAGRTVRIGVPLSEERQRLESLLQRLIADADVHASLTEEQKRKLAMAGKLDLGQYFDEQAALCAAPSGGKVFTVPQQQIAGAKVQLPPVLLDAESAFQKALHGRLSPAQLAKLAIADRDRARFHREAIVSAFAVDLTQRVALTAKQAEGVQLAVARQMTEPDDDSLAAYRLATLRQLTQLRFDEIKPLLDDWQQPAAREYLSDVSVTARGLETQPEGATN